MPVLIIGADCDVGRELSTLLLAQDAQVRVYVETDDAGFRAAGCKVAVGEIDDIGRIEAAMEQVHTVVHLASGPEPPRGRTLEWFVEETVDVAVRAAVSADVVRFLALSDLGAGASAQTAFLRARGRAEDMVTSSGIQHALLRCAPVLGPGAPLTRSLARAARGVAAVAPAPGSQRLNPVWAGDVAAALLSADARDAAVSGTWEIGGPDAVTYDELIQMATGRRRIVHRRSVPGLPGDLSSAYRSDNLANSSAFARQFGFAPHTSLDRSLALSLPERESKG